MRFGKIASSAEYRMDELFQNCQFLEPNFDFSNGKNIWNFLIFQFGQFQTSSSKNMKNFQFGKFQKFAIWQIKKISIWKFPKISNL